jgi:hypothetical protein
VMEDPAPLLEEVRSAPTFRNSCRWTRSISRACCTVMRCGGREVPARPGARTPWQPIRQEVPAGARQTGQAAPCSHWPTRSRAKRPAAASPLTCPWSRISCRLAARKVRGTGGALGHTLLELDSSASSVHVGGDDGMGGVSEPFKAANSMGQVRRHPLSNGGSAPGLGTAIRTEKFLVLMRQRRPENAWAQQGPDTTKKETCRLMGTLCEPITSLDTVKAPYKKGQELEWKHLRRIWRGHVMGCTVTNC